MFRRRPQEVEQLVRLILRENGLETPLLQRRLVEAWEEVAGSAVAPYTEQKEIRGQTLWVKITNPALRADLQMRKTQLVAQLNATVGAQLINDIRFY